MPTTALTPEDLDAQAARLHDTEAWQRVVTGWDEVSVPAPAHPSPAGSGPLRPEPPHPAPAEPGPPSHGAPCPPPHPAASQGTSASPVSPEGWRSLLSVPVEQLVADAERALPPAVPPARPLPGRLGAMLPDRLHSWRRIGQPDVPPSVHLAHARRILTEWGWQNTPYRLRNARGARCICGAMLTAHRLGHGSAHTVDRAGAWMIAELRAQGWTGLIGPWNRHPDRTAADALALIDATIARAARAGQ
ncbi:hypothetical protein [Streptomyces sp. NPDC059783]|uniref:DUF6197 family protein n=1 Tax=Streptomyces sp. NPDC059783 TaxID=3346944 RepID=UPI0036468F4F